MNDWIVESQFREEQRNNLEWNVVSSLPILSHKILELGNGELVMADDFQLSEAMSAIGWSLFVLIWQSSIITILYLDCKQCCKTSYASLNFTTVLDYWKHWCNSARLVRVFSFLF